MPLVEKYINFHYHHFSILSVLNLGYIAKALCTSAVWKSNKSKIEWITNYQLVEKSNMSHTYTLALGMLLYSNKEKLIIILYIYSII